MRKIEALSPMPRCPVCRTEEEERAFIERYVSPFNNQEYKLYHCKTCDLQWWEPLKIVPEFYEQEGEEGYAVMHLGIRETLGENHKMFFKHMPVSQGRLLDVGCGDGVFLVHAQRAGFEVWGIDFDSKSIKVCQEKRGLKNTFVASPWEFADYCEKHNLKFDVITFFEVLEHQDDPVGFLEAIKRILKPGGWIAGSVPNRESWIMNMSRLLNRQGDAPPHHFLRFSESSLINILERQPYSRIICRKTSIKLEEVAYIYQNLLFKKLAILIKTFLTKNKDVGEGLATFKSLSLPRRFVFVCIKSLRNLLLIIPYLLVLIKYKDEGKNIYFQVKFK